MNSEQSGELPARPTSRDVARRAGVSQAVVSYVLTGARPVSPERRARVLAAIEELGYRPSASARALRQGHSNEITVALPDSPLFLEIVQAMRQHVLESGYVLRVQLYRHASPEERAEFLADLHARRPAGVVTVSSFIAPADAAALRRHSIVCVYIGPESRSGHTLGVPLLPLRVSDAGYLAARHLLDRGHRRLGLVEPAAPSMPSRAESAHVTPRHEGMQRAVAATDGATLTSIPMHRSLEDARRIVAWLQQEDRPTGIYAFNDDFAFHLLAALYEHGVPVPERIALVGTDDTYFCHISCPALTSIRFDEVGLGTRAVELIDALRRSRQPAREFSALPVPRLIHRRSS